RSITRPMTKLAALLVLLALGLAACGGSDDNGPSALPEPTAPSEPAAVPDPAPEPPATADPGSTGAPESAPPTDTPSGKPIQITPDFEDELRVDTGGWTTDFTRHTVPLNEFLGGGPPRDGIAPIDEPTFDSVEEAGEYLEAREPVVEVVIDGEARAYPLRVLVWHEIANDVLAGTPVSVTFCPLCYTAIAFDRRFNGQVLDFGTTGNLRNSDLVMWDRQTETWWQQFSGEGVVGLHAGELLTQIPAAIAAWEDFAARHPDGTVLSQDTGFDRPYGQQPYVGYDSIDQPPFFPVANADDDRLPPKERVALIDRGDDTVVVPFGALEAAGTISVDVAGEMLTVEWIGGVRSSLNGQSIGDSEERGSARVTDAAGELVTFDTPFWFAVAAFRPDARVVDQ
ncbi:MAG: DUF3179 domain-containing (seleno)protein, partial [Gaiellaceae bacterium]